jgi:uncharacterized protein
MRAERSHTGSQEPPLIACAHAFRFPAASRTSHEEGLARHDAKPGKVRRIMIAGGSGLIGRHLSATLLARGDEIIVLARDPATAELDLPGAAVLAWQPGCSGRWQLELEAVDALVNLAGAPFLTPWHNEHHRRAVIADRHAAIASLLEALERTRHRPAAFISTSSIAVYGFRRDDETLTEQSAPDIGPTSKDVLALETLALEGEKLATRVALPRIGLMLAPDGGTLQPLVQTLDHEPIGPVEPGTQWCSWVHVRDVVGLIISAIDNDHVRGAVNVTAPNPVRNYEFAESLAGILSRPLGQPIPARKLHLATGRAALAITHGQCVLPIRALKLGYTFRYATLNHALRDVVGAACPRVSTAARVRS